MLAGLPCSGVATNCQEIACSHFSIHRQTSQNWNKNKRTYVYQNMQPCSYNQDNEGTKGQTGGLRCCYCPQWHTVDFHSICDVQSASLWPQRPGGCLEQQHQEASLVGVAKRYVARVQAASYCCYHNRPSLESRRPGRSCSKGCGPHAASAATAAAPLPSSCGYADQSPAVVFFYVPAVSLPWPTRLERPPWACASTAVAEGASTHHCGAQPMQVSSYKQHR